MAIAEVLAGVAALNNALGIAKSLREVEKSYDAAALKLRISDLIDQLLDGKLALTDAREQLVEQTTEIERLKSAFADKAELITDRGYKYKADGDLPSGYPICPKCEQLDGRIVTLVQDGHWRSAKCPVCASKFSPVDPHDPVAARKRTQDAAEASEKIAEAGRALGASIV